MKSCCFFCQAEDGIRDLVRSRGVGDVYKRQVHLGGDGVLELFGRLSELPEALAQIPGDLRELALSLIHI